MRLFFIGYPGEMGGANTEAWHTIQLWRQYGVDVHLIPTWGSDPVWQAKLFVITKSGLLLSGKHRIRLATCAST